MSAKKQDKWTIDLLYQRVMRDHWSAERFKVSGWQREVINIYAKNIGPVFGPSKVANVRAVSVRNWHKAMADRPTTGNRSMSVLSMMFRYAEEQELIPQNTNPCNLVRVFPERKRKRYATVSEMQKIDKLLQKHFDRDPAGVTFIYLLMFTGSRPRAIERARWDQVREIQVSGETYGILTFAGKSSAKTGEDEQLILPPQAMKLLAKFPRPKDGTLTGVPMPRYLWDKVTEEAGCEDLWARDWRRTFASIGFSSGIGIGTIGEILNHQSVETTKVYAKIFESKKLQAVNSIAKEIEEILR